MELEAITLALFSACNAVRLVAYIPQIYKAATDADGARGVSQVTWSMFLIAHLSTIAYALVNRADLGLALCFAGNAICCAIILGIVFWRGRSSRPGQPAHGEPRRSGPRAGWA
jgi:hypothetical protein